VGGLFLIQFLYPAVWNKGSWPQSRRGMGWTLEYWERVGRTTMALGQNGEAGEQGCVERQDLLVAPGFH
jgi:hypothetical protein